jgi:phosphatidylserine/phosphatidylglycerophosphate/cardiolipin synthase-like enzyme
MSPAPGDLVIGRLSYIHPDSDCEIRVAEAMFHDNRMAVVNRLKELKKGGCDVKVLGNDGNFEPGARAQFADKPNAIEVRFATVHDKYMTVKARYGAEGMRYLVFTGSHNLAYGANYTNDELFARLDGQQVWKAYRDHWDAAWAVSTAP